MRVLDFTCGIAGAYCTKLLADAGADVVKVEPPEGDPLRRRGSGGLFEFLNQSKRSVSDGHRLLGRADVIVTGDPAQAGRWHGEHPGAVVVAVSPFGAAGPWAGRPTTEFTLQAACGSMGNRGLPEKPPLPVGGAIGEWVTGTYAALAAAAAVGVGGARFGGRLVDVAMLDCMAVTLVTYPSVFASFSGWPDLVGTGRSVEVPSVEPTSDGFAVFTTNSAQQFQDFAVMIGRPEWADDAGLLRAAERFARRDEFLGAVHGWSRQRTSAQALEEAALLRIPSGPVLDGSTVADFEQFVARGVYSRSPSGRFRQPRPPYRIEGIERRTPAPAPEAGADDATVDWPARPPEPAGSGPLPSGPPPSGPPLSGLPSSGPSASGRPLEGVRVLDCTAWWAGPSATHALAALGADVIKVEAVKRPDLMRMSSVRGPGTDQWWEWGPLFHSVNASKRGVTLDLTRPEGVEVFLRLAATADVVVENYTPRVMEQFGLGWDRLHAANPRLIMVRMPAFGLDGPWRDRTGFAQTMECISGMAWVTGFPDGPPVLPRGACDPLAGMHAVFATIMALRTRAGDGRGRMVESTMVESALNATAEQVIEWDTSGTVIGRDGAGSPGSRRAVHACAGVDQWVAVAAETEPEWQALCRIAGADPAGDGVGAAVVAWCATRSKEEAAETLVAAGVPAAAVVAARDIVHNPQLRFRRLFEVEDHPVTGRHELPGLPLRMSDIDTWLRRPSPTLGQDNDEVLSEVVSASQLAELRAAGVIGEGLGGQ